MFEKHLKRISDAIRAELNDIGGKPASPRKLCARYTFGNPDIEKEVFDALHYEVSAETTQMIMAQARDEGIRMEPVNLADVTTTRAQVEARIAVAKTVLVGEIAMIVSPTVLTCMGISGFGRAFGVTNRMYCYTLDDVKVFVDQYAADSTPILLCGSGWVEYTEHDMIEKGDALIDPHTKEPYVTFQQPAVLRVNASKTRVIPIEGLMTLGFL